MLCVASVGEDVFGDGVVLLTDLDSVLEGLEGELAVVVATAPEREELRVVVLLGVAVEVPVGVGVGVVVGVVEGVPVGVGAGVKVPLGVVERVEVGVGVPV